MYLGIIFELSFIDADIRPVNPATPKAAKIYMAQTRLKIRC
jgi:hypothetical protein